MKSELKAYLCSILNAYWNNSLQICEMSLSKEEMEEVCCFTRCNRIEGYIYNVLKNHNESNPLFQQCKLIYEENLRTYDRAIEEIKYVCKCLENEQGLYAMVNGSYTIPFVCKPGERIQRDIDICISNQGYPQIERVLLNNDFFQATYKDGIIRKASRVEKIVALKNSQYIIPFYKGSYNDEIEDIWVDIDVCNLSEQEFKKLLSPKSLSNGCFVNCFDLETNIVYSCKSIYSKIKNYRYLQAKQDCVLHYFCELVQMIKANSDVISWDKVVQRSILLDLEPAVFYGFSVILDVFCEAFSDGQIAYFNSLLSKLQKPDISSMKAIYDEKGSMKYRYDCSESDYLFQLHREELLLEQKELLEG